MQSSSARPGQSERLSLHERKKWGGKRESNPQPPEPQSGALPVELFPPQEPNYSKQGGGKTGSTSKQVRRAKGTSGTDECAARCGRCLRTRIPGLASGWNPADFW